MEEQLINNCILDQFINSHEQSYEEFLSTFTYLLKEEERKMIQGCKKSLRKSFSDSDISNGDKQDGLPERSNEKLMSFPPQTPSENKMVINESWKSGDSDGNGLSLSERAQVDHYLETDMDGEPCNAGSFVLPGEVEEIETCCSPSFEKSFQQKLKISSVQQPLDKKAEELLGDDVQPFSLDEEFDYDNVALTSKFSEAELMPM
ncbi:protein C11orf74 homolog isoform X1 [Meleagris gallopavo]|uniref:Intraflagellar transport associated protein n=2 Tax=Meleagris gallopavo TaxID=9103 RepID=G1ND97_MELGA|nr:protein C11orf74 homolog isoform X1 [Meleagris gallopavo]XP_010709564.1 protein C11orf74 homolog isoform X1 [Meleagris gallopavo]XP_010709565.1 protein C11orf74 homolog isoform X1 [Meleagris gallopavo]XP_010709566.1 protein C11orf74 homolog isoform X1 [Meleagris gallopavo]